MTKTNLERRRTNYQRKKAAHELVKRMAMRAGYMEHERDGEGFDRFMADCETAIIRLDRVFSELNIQL